MPQLCQHLAGIHPLLLHTAEAQALFVFVQGVLAAAPQTPIPKAVRMFEEAFSLEDFNRRSALTRYYKMLNISKKDTKIFRYDKGKTHRNGQNGHVFHKSVGTDAAT